MVWIDNGSGVRAEGRHVAGMMSVERGVRAVFLDRDGVLNEVIVRDGQPGSPRTMAEFRPVRDVASLARLREAGWRLFIITNQPDVARGRVMPAVLDGMLARIRSVVTIDDARVCVHEDRHGCGCRKPKPGMIRDLARGWNVDLSRSYVVGDTWRDIGAARAAGCRSILIRRWYNAGVEADSEVATLGSAVDLLLANPPGR